MQICCKWFVFICEAQQVHPDAKSVMFIISIDFCTWPAFAARFSIMDHHCDGSRDLITFVLRFPAMKIVILLSAWAVLWCATTGAQEDSLRSALSAVDKRQRYLNRFADDALSAYTYSDDNNLEFLVPEGKHCYYVGYSPIARFHLQTNPIIEPLLMNVLCLSTCKMRIPVEMNAKRVSLHRFVNA